MNQNGIEPTYRLARSALLDALVALGPHRDSVILVGSQAIYLHTGNADFAIAEYTTDGDLALERQDSASRLRDKDAFDIFRILRAIGSGNLASSVWFSWAELR